MCSFALLLAVCPRRSRVSSQRVRVCVSVFASSACVCACVWPLCCRFGVADGGGRRLKLPWFLSTCLKKAHKTFHMFRHDYNMYCTPYIHLFFLVRAAHPAPILRVWFGCSFSFLSLLFVSVPSCFSVFFNALMHVCSGLRRGVWPHSYIPPGAVARLHVLTVVHVRVHNGFRWSLPGQLPWESTFVLFPFCRLPRPSPALYVTRATSASTSTVATRRKHCRPSLSAAPLFAVIIKYIYIYSGFPPGRSQSCAIKRALVYAHYTVIARLFIPPVITPYRLCRPRGACSYLCPKSPPPALVHILLSLSSNHIIVFYSPISFFS